ncbi:MAG TPA: FAD-dependent tricarballylate dehydrogenase TcuA [Gaiellaceae bacterium]
MIGKSYDVVVVGGGNAGLVAALTAREHVEHVAVVEKAPATKRGGNSFYTGGRMRIPHHGIADLADLFGCDVAELGDVEVDPYPDEAFYHDLQLASRYQCNEDLARLIASESRAGVEWMTSLGAKFELALGHDDIRTGTTLKLIGGDDIQHYEGGPGLVETLTRAAETRGIEIMYEASAKRLVRTPGGVEAVVVETTEGPVELRARAIVMAAGGFEASPTMRASYLGAGWDLAKVRGTEFNTGDGLTMALEAGARAYGHWAGCHSVAGDYFAPEFADRAHGETSERVSYRFGITVDRNSRRYFDEGADLRAFTYAVSGRNIIEQADGFAVQIFDAKTIDLVRSPYRAFSTTRTVSDDLRVIATEMNLDPDALVEAVEEFNKAVQPGEVDFAVRDGKATKGITPKKSNWALPLDTPPYTAFPVGPAITFTFGGVRANTRGEVLDQQEVPIAGLYAAGEMVGGIYYYNYPGGSGLVSGLVMGRAAGRSAGERARSLAATAETPVHAV